MQGAGGVGGLLCESSSQLPTPSSFFPTYDGNGNISEYLTSTGTIAAHFEYDAFGNTIINTDSINQFTYKFSTKPQDVETGLYYYGYRYYDAATGRWINRDRIEEHGGNNLYGFLGNNSSNLIDILGDSWRLKFAFDRSLNFAGGRGYISLAAKADLNNGNGSLAISATVGARVFLTEFIPGGFAGTAIGVLLDKFGVVQEGRIGAGGSGAIACSCPDGQRSITCSLVEFKLRISLQILVGYQGDSLRLLGQASGGGEWDLLTGGASLIGNIGIRAQYRKFGAWFGVEYSTSGAIPLPFTLPKISGGSFSIPLPDKCECLKQDFDASQYLNGLLNIN